MDNDDESSVGYGSFPYNHFPMKKPTPLEEEEEIHDGDANDADDDDVKSSNKNNNGSSSEGKNTKKVALGMATFVSVATALVCYNGNSGNVNIMYHNHKVEADVVVSSSMGFQDCCLPPEGVFSGISSADSDHNPYETCWGDNYGNYCWSKSYSRCGPYFHHFDPNCYVPCEPNGNWGPIQVNGYTYNISSNGCGLPCQEFAYKSC